MDRTPGSAALAALLLVALLPAPPALGSPAAATRVHEVYPGQTLGMIAKRYNISIDELCRLNSITRRTLIRPGQKLKVPETETAETDEHATRPAAATSAPPAVQPASRQLPATARGAATAKPGAKAPAPSRPESYVKKPARRGWVTLIGTTGDFVGFAVDKKGRALPTARTGFDRALGSWRTGQRAIIDERMVQLLAQVSDHFGGRAIRAVSGFRPYSPQQYTAHSRHNSGEAIDFTIPGVPNRVVRDYLRSFGSVGVGYYPNSSFVHFDVRPASTYWVDYSRPGEAPRYAGVDGRDPGAQPAAGGAAGAGNASGAAGAVSAGGAGGATGVSSTVAGTAAPSEPATDPGH